jgi:hypothetical protein
MAEQLQLFLSGLKDFQQTACVAWGVCPVIVIEKDENYFGASGLQAAGKLGDPL